MLQEIVIAGFGGQGVLSMDRNNVEEQQMSQWL